MPLPAFYKIDFKPCRKDLIEQALGRMLAQHYDKCVLRQFVAAVMREVNELYDAIIDMQEMRTLHEAEAYNLDALGRIVGEPRNPYRYDESRWLFADRMSQRPDATSVWCLSAPFAAFLPVGDTQYRMNILCRIVKNHTLVASVPEIERLTFMVAETLISYAKTGPMQVAVLVPSTITATVWNILTQARTDLRADSLFAFPYPATLWFDETFFYVPDPWFCADRTNAQRCDQAHVAVGVPYQPGGIF